LIVGIGASWAAIQENSALAAIMPVKGRGTQIEATSLRTFFDHMAAPAVRSRELDNPVVVTSADLAEGAVRTLGESGPQGSINLITMRTAGSGRVVATAASLRDLTTHVVLAEDKFFAALLELNEYTEKFKQAQNSMTTTLLEPQYLYEPLTEPISFGTATAVRGLLAFLFVGGYIVLATIASWAWLKRRKLAHQKLDGVRVLRDRGQRVEPRHGSGHAGHFGRRPVAVHRRFCRPATARRAGRAGSGTAAPRGSLPGCRCRARAISCGRWPGRRATWPIT